MTTYADLIEETRHHLMTGQVDRINVLDVNITSSQDTLVLRHANRGVSEGSRLVIGLEEMHVISTTPIGATTQCTVVRGFAGSSETAHTAGDVIYCNPQFSDFRISKYINQGLDNLSTEGLFQIRDVTLNSNNTVLGYELTGTTKFLDVWRVKYDTTGPASEWPILRSDQYFVDNSANTTDFTSGKSLTLRNVIMGGQTIQLSYRSGFDYLTTLSDDVLTVSGLHAEAHDLPPLYAAICLLAGREIKRSFLNRQPEPRRQEEVPPGAANQSMRPLIERYYSRINSEVKRLKRLYPQVI